MAFGPPGAGISTTLTVERAASATYAARPSEDSASQRAPRAGVVPAAIGPSGPISAHPISLAPGASTPA